MFPIARVIIVAAACSLPLGACVNFDPMEFISGDFFNNKKPLPGQRKDLFPEGVPGVAKGVPSDLIRGNQATALQEEAPRQVLLPDEPKPKPKPKAKPKPKPQVVQQPAEPERRPTAVTVRPQQQQQQQSQPSQGQWPDPPAQRQQPQQQTQWPDPPGGGARPPAGGGGVAWPDPPTPR